MSGVFNYRRGNTPLLISFPHDGCRLPRPVSERMTAAGMLVPDTDWHIAELYDFAANMGASMLVANYSRYVIDLNRPATNDSLYPGQLATGLCPTQTFAGDAIYRDSGIDDDEVAARTEAYWRPYHDRLRATLEELRQEHGYALLWDAHSIPSRVPRLFAGELPALNIGTFGGRSCDAVLEDAVTAVAEESPYSTILNGRFQGGFITRAYGDPVQHVHAVQLEIAQRVYMDEQTRNFDAVKATQLRGTLRRMLETLMQTGEGLSI